MQEWKSALLLWKHSWVSGVGFYINKKITRNILETKGVSEQTAIVKMEVNKNTIITITQAYASTLKAALGEKSSFYKLLGNIFVNVLHNFDGKLGGDNIARKCLGKWASQQTNGNGD